MLLTESFERALATHDLAPLRRTRPHTLQLNLGRLCNQACRHCHVDASPSRTELMDARTVARVLELLAASPGIDTVDITGGAPELNPRFRGLVDALLAGGRRVMVRCNLTVMEAPGQSDLPRFYAERGVHVVASLPCYTAENVDRQRGDGVFAASLEGLRRLNAVGYGAAEGGDDPRALRLDLVYNPGGPSLPPPQPALEADYRVRLQDDFGLRFDRLLTLANMPIHRFADDLARQGRLDGYLALLADSFNPAAVPGLMCRSQVSVGWDGRLADCDFNLVLGMRLGGHGPRTVFELDSFDALGNAPIAVADHCLGCTAGQGSSCGGALAGDG